MSLTDLLVALGGIAAIIWVNWYFFFAGKTARNGVDTLAADMVGNTAGNAVPIRSRDNQER
jgi:hypothetical protein